jgi:hypothetical protein
MRGKGNSLATKQCDCVTRGYGDHSPRTRPKEEVTHGGRGRRGDVCTTLGALEVEEVEEVGVVGVVHDGRGPRRGDPRGIGGEAV